MATHVYAKMRKDVPCGLSMKKANIFSLKLECINHAIKNYSKKLYSIKADTKNVPFQISIGFHKSNNACYIKWKSLVRRYKIRKSSTGRAPSRFQYYAEIDNIVGQKPANFCPLSLESSSVAEKV